MTKKPAYRKLRGYAFDPSLSLNMDTVLINDLTYKVIWEASLLPGPSDQYLEVIDVDPTVGKFCAPVDLNHTYILAHLGAELLRKTKGHLYFCGDHKAILPNIKTHGVTIKKTHENSFNCANKKFAGKFFINYEVKS